MTEIPSNFKQNLKIAIVNSSAVENCAFDIPPCGFPGRSAQVSKFVAGLLAPNINAIFVPAKTYSYQGPGDNFSIMGMLKHGLGNSFLAPMRRSKEHQCRPPLLGRLRLRQACMLSFSGRLIYYGDGLY